MVKPSVYFWNHVIESRDAQHSFVILRWSWKRYIAMMSLPAGCSGHGLLNIYLGGNSYCHIIHSSMYTVDTIISTLEGRFDKSKLIILYRLWQHPRNDPKASHSKPWHMPTYRWLSQAWQWTKIMSQQATATLYLALSLGSIHWSLSLSSRLMVQRVLQRLQKPCSALSTLSCTLTWDYNDVHLPVFGLSTSPRKAAS